MGKSRLMIYLITLTPVVTYLFFEFDLATNFGRNQRLRGGFVHLVDRYSPRLEGADWFEKIGVSKFWDLLLTGSFSVFFSVSFFEEG